VASAIAVSAIGSTMTDLGPWYQGLRQPGWKPPDAAFGLIWTTIFALATASAVTAWSRATTAEARTTIIGLFALNGFLNVLWSLLFFRLRRPDWAMIEVAFLWLSIAAIIIYVWRHSKIASLLMVPYLIWVATAAKLNWDVIQLNGPFG
jgi:tryptophan-rich sensory protein